MNKAFRLIKNKALEFLFLFINADAFYISARYNLQYGWVVPGCLNAHQAIELYLKAILKLNHEQKYGHNLVSLFEKYQYKESYFLKVIKNVDQMEFLQELSEAYRIFRYGEAGAKSNSSEIIKIIDELSFNLRTIYLKNIKSPSSKIYIPPDAAMDFLRDNQFFSSNDLTNNPLAKFGFPTFDLNVSNSKDL